MSRNNGSLLAQAQKAIKTGRKEHARQLLHQASRQDPAIDRARTLVEQRLELASLTTRDESQPAHTPWRDVGWTIAVYHQILGH